MSLLLANLLIRFIPCMLTIKTNKTSLEWTWHGNFLRCDLLAPVGMQIILMERSTLKMVPLDPNRQMHYTVKKQGLLEFLKKWETKWQKMKLMLQ